MPLSLPVCVHLLYSSFPLQIDSALTILSDLRWWPALSWNTVSSYSSYPIQRDYASVVKGKTLPLFSSQTACYSPCCPTVCYCISTQNPEKHSSGERDAPVSDASCCCLISLNDERGRVISCCPPDKAGVTRLLPLSVSLATAGEQSRGIRTFFLPKIPHVLTKALMKNQVNIAADV